MLNSFKRLVLIAVTSSVSLMALKVLTFQNDSPTIATNSKCGLEIEINMNQEENTLNCKINSLCINSIDGNKVCIDNIDDIQWLKDNLNLKNNRYTINEETRTIDKQTRLSAFKFNDRLAYIKYDNEDSTGNRELMLTSLKVDEFKMEKVNARMKKLNNPIQNKLLARSYDKASLVLSEAITGGKLNSSDLIPEINKIEDNMYFGDSSKYKLNIKLNDLGDININELSGYIGGIEISYLREDGVIRVSDVETNTPYLYISSINTGVFDYEPSEFIATDIENFYESSRNLDENRKFSTYAFIGGKNFYVIKIKQVSEELILNNILLQLGLKTDDILNIE